ncbi:MAG: S-layer family protein [Symploca sp. SIO3E6]|nr:S-layer family protein [Caldora sp. SIO3E6]
MNPRFILSLLVSSLLLKVTSLPVNGQIVPDLTLPNPSDVRLNGNTFEINGGTTAGANLFHSFSVFSVSTDTEAFFNNSLTIDNIINRVTGGEISNIDGLIRANGRANLFLINPNGIIFGNNASLDIGGSFFGSSAESIHFADSSIFSATEPTATPLLTISTPIGLQLGQNPGAIRVSGAGHRLVAPNIFLPINRGFNNSGLQVKPGNTLALVGGDLTLEGGILTAEGGRIELGSVSQGLVSLTPPSVTMDRWTLGYESVQNFEDIQLLSQALVDASGISSGSIQVQGQNIQLRDGSIIFIQNQGLQPAGSINVHASELLEMSGTTPNGQISSSLQSEVVGFGQGGDIEVSTQRLLIQDGGLIVTRVFSNAPGGSIEVNASESAQFIGFANAGTRVVSSGIGATTLSAGDAGNVTVSTGKLTLLDGANISSSTFGTGSGGDVTVNASESVELIGIIPNLLQPSILSATTLNQGDAGSLTINTSRLVVRDGGRIDSSTLATGSAGRIHINALESVEVSGTVPGALNPSVVISSANIVDPILQQLFRLPPVPTGSSGNVTIKTGILKVTDGGLVSVRHDGTGNAGILQVNANSIFLDTGAIAASSLLGKGGDIELQVGESLILRNQSEISTRAGTQNTGRGDGGNISIDTPVLALLEQSNINANAFKGNGGKIQIIIQGLFVSPDSFIIASSELGIDGEVIISNPDVDPSSGLVDLPTKLIDSSNQIIAGCPADLGNVFVITGQGGLPANPTQPLQNQLAWQDWRFLSNPGNGPPPIVGRESLTTIQQKHSPSEVANHQPSLIEATGWIVNPSGRVELVAQIPDYSTNNSWYQAAQCGKL